MRFIALKKYQNSYSKYSAFASSEAFFQFKLCSFCCRGVQEYFLPQDVGHPSYATA